MVLQQATPSGGSQLDIEMDTDKFFYSASTSGFYCNSIHESMPADVVEIETPYYQELMASQSAGFSICADTDGFPVALERPVNEGALERTWRDSELTYTDIKINILLDTLVDEKVIHEWRSYRQFLRDWPQHSKFPSRQDRPVRPVSGVKE
jgi:hypothetical protein